MKQYPSILGSAKAPLGKPCIAYYKYDGSNLRWEWSKKQGWHKFGTRRHLFDVTDPLYSQAIEIFLGTMADDILARTRDYVKNPERFTVFTEFFGASSFAGSHDLEEPKELRLLDVDLYKKGIITVRDFDKLYGDAPYTAKVVYRGNLNAQFITDVKEGGYPVFEGVIAKGDEFMVKIKTHAYFDQLKKKYPERWEDFGE